MPEGPPPQSQINSALVARKYPGSINPIPSGVQQSVDLEFETGLSSVLQLGYFPSIRGQIPATVNVISVAANSTIGWLLSGGAGTVVNYSIYVVPATGAPYTNNYAVALNSIPQSVPVLSLPNSTQTLTILSGSGYTSDSNNNFSTVVVPAVIPVNVAANGNLGWQISGLIGTNVNYYVTLSNPSPGNPTIVSSSVLLNASPTLVPRIAAGDGTQTITLTSGNYTLGSNTTATITVTTPTVVSVVANGNTGWSISGAVGTVVNYSILSTPTTGSPSTSNASVTLASNPQAVPRLTMMSGTQLLTVLAGNNYTISGNSSATITVTSTPQNNSDPIRDINPMQSAYTSTPTFQNLPNIIATKIINAPLTISPDTTGAIAGAMVIMRFVADGVNANTPTFTGMRALTGSSGWDNRAGFINLVQMLYDGTDYWYSIGQDADQGIADTTAPLVNTRSFNAAGNQITLFYNEVLLTSSVPPTTAFTGATVTNVAISGTTVILTVNPAIAPGTSITLGYTGTGIKDLAGNSAANFSGAVSVPAATDTTPPTLSSSAINSTGNSVTLTFSETLLATSIPPTTAFTGATVSAVAISGAVITLTLGTAIAAGASATIVYSGTTIKDSANNNAAGFSTTVTRPAAGDTTPPTLSSSSINAAGTSVILTFNEALLTTSTPTPSNFSGATVSTAVVSGSTVTLTLSTAIAAGASATITYAGTTIKDVAGNNAAGFSTTVTVAAAGTSSPLALQTRAVGLDEVAVGTYKHNGANNTGLSGVTATKVFVGDKTLEMTPTTITGFMDMGLEETNGSPAGNGLALEIGFRINLASSIAVFDNSGASIATTPFGAPIATDLYRISRTGSTFKLQGKRGAGNWTDFYTYNYTTTAAMFVTATINKTNDQINIALN
jgi:hypothetical protein